MAILQGWEKIRRWIDNEPEDEISHKIRQAHDNKSESEVFMQKLLNSVEAELKDEIVRVPNTNKAYVPEQFVVYLGGDVDRNLRRDKREFFEQGLSVMIFERAKEMAGKLELTTKKIKVKIAVEPELNNEIEVRAVSANSIKTVRESAAAKETATINEPAPLVKDYATVLDDHTIEDFETHVEILYWVEIWQSGERLNEFPIIQRTNTIGREDHAQMPNLRLPTDNRKISRRHAEISVENDGEIRVTALHKNPTVVAGKVLRKGENAKIGDGEEIQIYDFTLKIKSKK